MSGLTPARPLGLASAAPACALDPTGAASVCASDDAVIRTKGLTKDYGCDRGIFDVDLEVRKGEVFGYVGTNGSGKTTTIRALMGFVKSTAGTAELCGSDCWTHAAHNMLAVSYIPGEVAFPDLRTGVEFLKSQARHLGVTDFSYMNRVIEALQLDPTANLKRMSKGMKQKTAIAAALMARRDVLILDEPTTGLDPLMRDAFLDLVRAEKEAGHTVFMSSHIFEEMEEVCDRVAMIRDGRVIGVVDLDELRRSQTRRYALEFATAWQAEEFDRRFPGGRFSGARSSEAQPLGGRPSDAQPTGQVTRQVAVQASQTAELFQALDGCGLTALSERRATLEDIFLQAYDQGAE